MRQSGVVARPAVCDGPMVAHCDVHTQRVDSSGSPIPHPTLGGVAAAGFGPRLFADASESRALGPRRHAAAALCPSHRSSTGPPATWPAW